jgi:hypothetical protein
VESPGFKFRLNSTSRLRPGSPRRGTARVGRPAGPDLPPLP